MILRGMFDCLGIKTSSYIDVGAHHPFRLSNTALFYKAGSRGVNIEPNPLLFEEIKKFRKDDINIMAGIGLQSCSMPFYVMNADTLSTFSKEEADSMCREHGFSISKVIQVQVETLKDIINNYCKGVFPDFMSLDTEGLDEMILGSLKECSSLPKIICTETWEYGLTANHIPEICSILDPLGYMLFLDNHLNSIFVLRNLWESSLNAKRS